MSATEQNGPQSRVQGPKRTGLVVLWLLNRLASTLKVIRDKDIMVNEPRSMLCGSSLWTRLVHV